MALSDIIRLISRETGIVTTSSDEKASLIEGINTVAKKLYVEDDLELALVENVFNINQGSNQVALTPDAGWLRGLRYFDSRLRVPVNDLYPRYHTGGFNREAWPLQFRILNKSPFLRDIDNQSTITFTIPAIDADDIVITSIGTTSTSAFAREETTLPAGSLSVETIAVFDKVNTLTKTGRCLYDISIYDASGNLLGIWPNYQKQLEHIVFQVSDDLYNPPVLDRSSIEVLYKRAWIPFVDDTDDFMCGVQYDDVIAWKFIELYRLMVQKDTEAAKAAMGMVNETMNGIRFNDNEAKVKKLNFRKPNVYRAFDRLRSGYPWRTI